ncbi:MAG: hypothetical protein H6736_09180 [Alphaproteobacteria bacterium]|nr:hypothetical protein [Alphaproteobacteria bacterium]
MAWLARPAGNAFLRGQIEQRASAMIPGSVRIGSLATGLSGSATLEDVGLLDPSGVPLLTARTVEVTWGLPSPVELVVTGLDGRLTVGRDGTVDLRSALGTELPDLPELVVASVRVDGRLDLDIGGFTAALEDLAVQGSGRTVPLTGTLDRLEARLVTPLAEVPTSASGTAVWDDLLRVDGHGAVDGREVRLTATLADPFGVGGLDARAHGGLALHGPFRGEVEATVTATGTWGALAWHADVTGDTASSAVDGTLDLRDPAWPFTLEGPVRLGPAWTAFPEGTDADGRLAARGSLAPDGKATGDFVGAVRAAGIGFPTSSLGLALDRSGVTLDPLRLGGPHEARGHLGFSWDAVEAGALELRLDLARLADIGLPPGLEGQLAVDVDLDGTALDGSASVERVAWRGLTVPVAHGRLAGTLDHWSLAARVPLEVPSVVGRGVEVSDVRLPLDVRWAPGAPLVARGAGVAGHADVLGLAALDAARARLEVTARPRRPLQAKATVQADSARLTTVLFDGLEATADLRGDALTGAVEARSAWGAVSTRLRGDLQDDGLTVMDTVVTPTAGPAWSQDGPGHARLAGKGLEDVHLRLRAQGGCEADVDGAIGGEATLAVGLRAPVAPWAPLLPGLEELEGAVTVDGELSAPGGQPTFVGRVAASELHLRGLPLGGVTGDAWLRGDRAGLTGVWTAREDVEVGLEAEVGVDPARGVALDAPWSARARSEHLLVGTVDLGGTPRTPTVDGRGMLRWRDVVLGQVRATGDGGRVEVQGQLWQGHAGFSGVVEPAWDAWIAGRPGPVHGRFEGQVDVPWSVVAAGLGEIGEDADLEGGLTGRGTVVLDGWSLVPTGSFATSGRIGEHAVEGSGSLADGGLTGALDVGAGHLEVFGGHGPIDLRELPVIAADLEGEGVPLALITAFVPDLEDGEGEVGLRGHLDTTGARGHARLEGGAFRHRFLGVSVEDLDGEVELTDRGALSVALDGETWPARDRGKAPGRMTVAASAHVERDDVAIEAATVTLDRVHVVSRPSQKARLSTVGPLVVGGTARHPEIRGAVTVDGADLEIDRKLLIEADVWPAAPRELDPRITLVRDGMEIPREVVERKPVWSFLDADVEVDLGPFAEGSMDLPYLDGMGPLVAAATRVRMEGRVEGRVRVLIAEGRASAEGVVDVTDASARVASSPFTVDSGQLLFVDGDLLRPYVLARGSLALGGGVSVQMGLRGEPQGASLTLTSAQLQEGEIWPAVITHENPRLVQSNVQLATKLAMDIVSRTVFERVDFGRWELVGGGVQRRFHPNPKTTLVSHLAPGAQTRDAWALGVEYAPHRDVRLEGWLGNVDRWVGVGWRRRY